MVVLGKKMENVLYACPDVLAFARAPTQMLFHASWKGKSNSNLFGALLATTCVGSNFRGSLRDISDMGLKLVSLVWDRL